MSRKDPLIVQEGLMKKFLIGLDVGTSGAKSILADETGAVLSSATEE